MPKLKKITHVLKLPIGYVKHIGENYVVYQTEH